MINLPRLRDKLEQAEIDAGRRGFDTATVGVKFVDEDGFVHKLIDVRFEPLPSSGAPFILIEGESE